MTTDSHPNRRGYDLLSVERLVGLSDNVVAFALTLLVLQVTVPSLSQVADPASAADLAAQLAKQTSHLVSYVIAFYIIAQFWLVHRRVFRHVVGHRDSLAWWNFAFLATITGMPFTSNLLDLQAQGIGVAADSGLGGHQPRVVREWQMRGHGSEVDDLAASPLAHARQYRRDHAAHSEDVGLVEISCLCHRGLLDGPDHADASVVDQDVYASLALEHRGHA
jgi:Endosomal/lysosomal potassium channel TMEM175